jgi:DNA mismatch repair protein MutS2
MSYIYDQQALSDLEFDVITEMLQDFSHGESARSYMATLSPLATFEECRRRLQEGREFLSIRQESHGFPRVEFDEIPKELEMLKLRGSTLSVVGIQNILRLTQLAHEVIDFFRKAERLSFPQLRERIKDIKKNDKLVQMIIKVIDDKGKIRNTASPFLEEVRGSMDHVRKQINRNFNRVARDLKAQGWLAETTEAFVGERRVLSVLSGHKRKVKGQIIGSSKTGNWTFIEPSANIALNFELEQLADDEQKEIRRILQELTGKLMEFSPDLDLYQTTLIEFDILQAKTRLAQLLKSDLPGLSEEPQIMLKYAYHPLLLLTNQKNQQKTIPQTISLDKFNRILVISGPNAGGKSITLKTVGLLQLMLQSGLLVPCDSSSTMSFFHTILTDIGDNQSIENQLSTYSYRLKRMKGFLEVANRKTLLLLDEFGTGSDPDLGGALAEVFFEELYSKKPFGVITTHYTNIKTKAAQLRNAVNGCMLFDLESLEPLFELSIGQPVSSFTFEVAEINGIEKDLIEKAKGKLDDRKVNLDKLIADLQKEKGKVSKVNGQMLDREQKAEVARVEFEKRRTKYEERLASQQKMVDKNNDLLTLGKKLQKFITDYSTRGNNKALLGELRNFLGIEKGRSEEVKIKSKLKEKIQKKKTVKKNRQKNVEKISVGCIVKLLAGKERGTVLELDNGMAMVAFGVFKSRVEVEKIEYVSGKQ